MTKPAAMRMFDSKFLMYAGGMANPYGDVYRYWSKIVPTKGGREMVILFECGHEQISNKLAVDLVRMNPIVCVQCSRPNWDKLAQEKETHDSQRIHRSQR